jgi:hypothetical protein
MALLDQVREICTLLAPHGWADLMAAHGLDVTTADLASELTKPLPAIDRSIQGFEDFALEGRRGIEPGDPAQSLLFHALASPFVVSGRDGSELTSFPTAAELDVVEDYVYGVRAPSLSQLLTRSGRNALCIAAFAVQYRPSLQTPHERHAHVCFARTGIARVGTTAARYDGRLRGFLPTGDGDFEIRVLPARYAVYLAIRVPGDQALFVPMRFLIPDAQAQAQEKGDQERLRRIHLALGSNATWHEPDTSTPPFRYTEGIAELASVPDLAPGTVVPDPHEHPVEPAEFGGAPLTFQVPPNTPLSSSFNIAADGLFRHGPEYVHVRTKVTDAGEEIDLNERSDVEAVVASGGYRARHYLDFTGDGWITPVVPELAAAVPRTRSAYSLIAAPDFFPNTDQRTLSDWVANRLPATLARAVWRVPPDPLSDQRFAANLELPGGGFRLYEDAVTAIDSARRAVLGEPTGPVDAETPRHSHLPEEAAGSSSPAGT